MKCRIMSTKSIFWERNLIILEIFTCDPSQYTMDHPDLTVSNFNGNSIGTENINKHFIWASTRENLSSGVCKQHRRRPACVSAQSDQRLCYSLFRKYHMQTCYRWNFNFLASLCNWGDWFETHFVGHPEDRFFRDEAHMINIIFKYMHCGYIMSQRTGL